MRKIKTLMGILLLALVATLATPPAFAGDGAVETPGLTAPTGGAVETPGLTAPTGGAVETPGLVWIIFGLINPLI